jgi:hypothetical protein
MTARTGVRTALLLFLSTAIVAVTTREAFAWITGGEGNAPIADPGWPNGAAAIFNTKARIAWWEGPPFGGGQWHAECRGDAGALTAVLADFVCPMPSCKTTCFDFTSRTNGNSFACFRQTSTRPTQRMPTPARHRGSTESCRFVSVDGLAGRLFLEQNPRK